MLMPIILTALVVIFLITMRLFSHKERMAMIAQGLPLEDTAAQQKNQEERYKVLLSIGLIVGLVGLALTIGLITLGMGPWLLAGLLPLFIGLALVLTSLVLRPEKPAKKQEAPEFAPETFELTVDDEDEELEEDKEALA